MGLHRVSSIAAVAAALLACSCRGLDAAPEPRAQQPLMPAVAVTPHTADAPRLFYVGCAVTDFRFRSSLAAWGHSNELLAAAFGSWLGVPADRRMLLANPTPAQLGALLAEQLPQQVQRDDIVIVYIGTHHLKDQRLLLGRGSSLDDARLVGWLNRLDARVVLLADVCYAAAIEEAAPFDDRVIRLYAAGTAQKAPDLVVDGSSRTAQQFFASTQTAVRKLGVQHENFSLMGYLFAHALHRQGTAHQEHLRLDHIFQTLHDEQLALRYATRRTRMPTPAARNLLPLPLRNRAAMFAVEDAAKESSAHEQFAEIEAHLELPEEKLDVGYANLLLGKIYDVDVDVDAYQARLDALAADLTRSIGRQKRAAKVLPRMNRLLFETQQFEAKAEPYPEDFLLHRLLDKKAGRCAAFVSLYLALASRTGLPMGSVCVPEHIFIRWLPAVPGSDPDYKLGGLFRRGPPYLNVETTKAGGQLQDEIYQRMLGDASTDAGASFYLRPLSRRETIGALLSALGDALRKQGRLAEALYACKLAIGINVNDAEAWNNLGVVQRELGDVKLARAAYNKALSLHPYAEIYNNLASLEKEPAKRITLYRQALEIKPDLCGVWKNLSFAYYQTGNFQMAQLCVNRAREHGCDFSLKYTQDLERRLEQQQ
jgi:tetratricopeptide (TPR) repeat protein